MANIHSTAVVSSNAIIAENVQVGPYAVIEDQVEIDSGTTIGPHSVVHSYTRLGKHNRIHSHVVLGDAPQDISYNEQETWLEIGGDNVIREFCSIHRSTSAERATRVGSGCYIMCNSHIGHDCQVGNDVIITAYVGISGHVEIGDRAVIGGNVGIHQFCRIGALAMVGAYTPVGKDVLPFSMLGRDPVAHYKLNVVGLRRAGIKGDRYRALEQGMQLVRAGKQDQLVAETEELKLLAQWLQAPSKRGIYKFVR